MKVTYADLQNSRIPASIGSCADDSRLLALTNEALERLMYEGHWHNCTQRVRFCVSDGCVTQPPQVATIEKIAVCGQPVTLRTQWAEFMEGGAGIRNARPSTSSTSTCCGQYNGWCGFNEAIPKGYYCTFSDIIGINKRVNLVCDLASDVGVEVLVLGYDENGNWIRTSQGGSIQDGEIILLAQSDGTLSVNLFSSVTDIQFNEARDGQVWLYEYNVDTTDKRMIGQYQQFESRPNYIRYFIGNIISGTGSCTQTLIDAIVKLNFWPVKVPNDYLCVPCIPALKELLMGLSAAEDEPSAVRKVQIVSAAMVAAKAILNSQLQHFTGDGAVPTIEVVGSGPYNQPVYNLI